MRVKPACDASATMSRMRVVLDTNVLLSILVFDDPRHEPLRAAWRARRVVPLASNACLAEFERVLAEQPELAGRNADVHDAFADYRRHAERIEIDAVRVHDLPACRDPDDQKFLELAAAGGADALVTADKRLLELRRRVAFAIVTPEAFVAQLAGAMQQR